MCADKEITLRVGKVIEDWLLAAGLTDGQGYILILINKKGEVGVTANLEKSEDIAHILHDTGKAMLNDLDNVVFVKTSKEN